MTRDEIDAFMRRKIESGAQVSIIGGVVVWESDPVYVDMDEIESTETEDKDMTRDEIDARVLARMRREVDECIERDENPLLVEAERIEDLIMAMWVLSWWASRMLSAVAWATGLVLAFLFLRAGLAGPLGMDVATNEFWIGLTILLGLFACLVGREGRRG